MSSQTLKKARDRGQLVTTRNRSDAVKNAFELGRKIPPVMSEKHRKATSERQSLNNSGGRCKWFEVDGQRVQGTWERDIADKMTQEGIEWIKVGKKKDILIYELDGRQRAYTPDFYLPLFDLYLEIKGYWWGRDRAKMDAVIAQHPDLKIRIIEKKMFDAILSEGFASIVQ